jgi:hypothetical protein
LTLPVSVESLVQLLRQLIHRMASRLARPADSRIGKGRMPSHATKR